MELIKAFFKLLDLFDKKEKRNTMVMIGLIIIGALAETVGVGIILPFVSLILDPQLIRKYEFLTAVYNWEFIGTYKHFVILLCSLLIFLFIFKSLYMLFLLYIQNRYSLNRQILMARRLFSSYMNKSYEFFFERNVAELQRNINVLVPAVIARFLIPALSLLTELLVVLFIFIILLIADPVSAIAIALILCMISVLYYIKVKNRLGTTSGAQNTNLTYMNKSVQEGIASIKEIKVMERESSFVDVYNKNSKGYAKAQAFYNLANQSPRLIIETIVVCGIVILVLINVLYGNEMNDLLPVLSLFAMAAVRIMPSMNRILGHLTNLKFSKVNLDAIYEDVREALINSEKNGKKFKKNIKNEAAENILVKEIVIENLTYRYPNTNVDILQKVNLTIKKGQSIGIVGQSGAGKTTLIDLILGLLKPSEGFILVDGMDIQNNMSTWRKNLGYVPQHIYLIDDTILKNVALGIIDKDIDEEKVWAALETAQMKSFVENLPNQLNTTVGQGGILLSGGQRQRIGIARALYHDPKVLILDEATSALDTEIEEQISEAIDAIGKSKTLIIIAHRISTLKNCDVIYKVDGGKIIEQKKH